MLTIKEIAFTGYPVTDIARARRFYEGTLGLKLTVNFEHEGRHWLEYDIGGGTLAVNNLSPNEWRPSTNGPSIALEVADFDAAVAHLRSESVPFVLEPYDTGVCQLAVVTDPDGNSLAIHRRKPQS